MIKRLLGSYPTEHKGSSKMNNIDVRISQMLVWLDINGTSGWDPYDIQGTKAYTSLFANKGIFTKLANRVIAPLSFHFPHISRHIFRAQKQENAKAHALLMLSFCNLYEVTQDEKYITLFKRSFEWLEMNNHADDGQMGWGYPFDWHSEVMIPKNTPLCVPTVLVGHSLIRAKMLGMGDFSEALNKIYVFLTQGLNIYRYNEEQICFSYSPKDHFRVLNANLYTASFLACYSKLTITKEPLQLALQAVNYVLREQKSDGSWGYWSELQMPLKPFYVDNYHTGISLLWLDVINKIYPQTCVEEALDIGSEYYTAHLYTRAGLPKQYSHKVYPIDIHSPAQFFITFSQVDDKISPDLVRKVYDFVDAKMWCESGFYIHKISKFGFKSRIAYTRWSVAWMLYALTSLQLKLKDKEL